jgi:hypothetical protein
MQGIRTVSVRAMVVCSRCGGTLWRDRIRRASSLVSARETKLPPLWRFRDGAWALFLELDYAGVHEDAPPTHPEKSRKITSAAAADKRNNQTSPEAGTVFAIGAGARCGAVITRITAVRMIAAAITVRIVMVSPSISQPRNKATTGFTNG